MQIQLLSDLHLETHPHWAGTPAPGADLLVLAGDVGSYQSGSLLTDSDFGLGRFSPHNGWPTPVLFVPGNHEYDTFDFDEAHARLRATCKRLGIIWLEREVWIWPADRANSTNDNGAKNAKAASAAASAETEAAPKPVRFMGTTLWTDFDAMGPLANAPSAPTANLLAQQLKARDKACRAANFHLKKTLTTRHGQPFLADAVRAQALDCQNWLINALAQPFDGDTVVVTHFAPSLLSADPRYGVTPGTAGFCNALDHLLPHAKLWLHGHLHAPSDYVHRGCRVVANPLGYARKNEQLLFKPASCIALNPV